MPSRRQAELVRIPVDIYDELGFTNGSENPDIDPIVATDSRAQQQPTAFGYEAQALAHIPHLPIPCTVLYCAVLTQIWANRDDSDRR